MKDLPARNCHRQMIFSLTSVLTLFALSTLFGLYRINAIGANLKEIAESHIPLTEIITEIESHQLRQSLLFERALRLGEGMVVKAEDRHRFEETLKEYADLAGKVDEKVTKGEQLAESAVRAALKDEQRNSFEDIGEHLKKIGQEHQGIDHRAGEVFGLVREGRLREAHALLETVEQEEGQLAHELDAFLMRIEVLTEQAALSAEHSEEQAYLWMLVLAGFAFSAIPGALYAIREAASQKGS